MSGKNQNRRFRPLELLESRTLMSVAEPNNTFATAVNLGLFEAGQSYSDLVSSTDTVDYFRFQVRGRGPFQARLRNTGGDGHAYMLLFHDKNLNGQIDTGERIATSGLEAGTTTENMTMPVVESGNVYYLGVYRATGAFADYSLRMMMDNAGSTVSTAADLGEFTSAVSIVDQVGAMTTHAYYDPTDAYKLHLVGRNSTSALYAQVEPLEGGDFLGAGPRIRYAKDDNRNGLIEPSEYFGGDQGDAKHRYLSLGFGNVGDAYIVIDANGAPYQNYKLTMTIDRAGDTPGLAMDLGTLTGIKTFGESVWQTLQIADEDHYRFTLNAPAKVSFPAIANASDVHWDIEDASRPGLTLIGGVSTIGGSTTLDPGTYTFSITQTRSATAKPVDFSVRLMADFAGDGPLAARKFGAIGNMTRVNDFVARVGGSEDARDYFSFSLNERLPFFAELKSVNGFDPNFALYKDLDDNVGGLELIAESNNRYALDTITTNLPAGKYQIVVTSGGGSGEYALTLWPGDSDDTFREASRRSVNRRAVGQAINGTIEDRKDVDLFSFTAIAGQRIVFDLDSRAGSNFDSYLRIFNTAGDEIVSNDNGAALDEKPGKFSHLAHTFATGGTFYAAVSSAGNDRYNPITGNGDRTGNSSGRYTLFINELPTGSNSISGRVFNDRNGNQILDAKETGLAGRLVFLDRDGDGLFDNDELGALTDAQGSFSIAAVPNGSQNIRLAIATGWEATTPAFSMIYVEGGRRAQANLIGVRKIIPA